MSGLNISRLRSRTFNRILLIKPSALGDVIHTLPVLVKLRARYPAARIDWLLTPAIADLVGHHPALSGVVPSLVVVDGPSWDGRPEVVALALACDAVYLVLPDAEAESREADSLCQLIPEQGARLAGCILSRF